MHAGDSRRHSMGSPAAAAGHPIATLPPWMQAMSFVLPLARGIAAARLVIAGASLRLVTPRIAGEQVIGATYALPGCFLFRSFEFQAKKRSTR